MRRQGINAYLDFPVRRYKVLGALRFLKLNNSYYADITVDEQRILLEPPADENLY